MTGTGTDREERLGRRLKELRTERGWTQEGLAEAMRAAGFGWRSNTVTKVEQAQRVLKATEAAVIAQVLDVDLAALLTVEPSGEVRVSTGRRREVEQPFAINRSELRAEIERVVRAVLGDEDRED
ncbi:helix-turn-helix domain-containing protein [Geodermatophilus sp. SYSU D00684]